MPDEIVVGGTGVPEASAQVESPISAPEPYRKTCKRCTELFDPKGTARKWCYECMAARAAEAKSKPKRKGVWAGLKPGTSEYKQLDRQLHREDRVKAKEERGAAAQLISSTIEPKDDEAKEILRDAGVKNPHVQDVLISHAKIAAAHFQIPYNSYLLSHGLRKTLADLNNAPYETPVIGEDQIIDGEVLCKRDLYYLWDLGYFRQDQTFEQWLEIRFKAKSSAFYLGKEILGMDFHELHQNWTEFFPQFSPLGLKPGFSMEDAKAWLGRQSKSKTFVLQSSRNAYKSSFAAILALCIILCQPSIRIRLVTATDDLASDFVAAIRGYFVVEMPDSPSLFAQLFGEYCITSDSGQRDMYECPLAHLNLVAATVEASSVGSKQAGRRCDLLLCDDVQEQESVSTNALREKGMNRFDLLQKLVEVGGYTISLSTPWHKKDISGTLIERAKNDPDTLTEIRIDPAWQILPHVRQDTPILELKETDVKLVFPERLTFQFLMSEAKKNVKQFQSQNLCIFPDDENSGIKIHFDIDQLHDAVRSPSFFDQSNMALELIGVYGALDCAWSISKFADYSSQTVARLYRHRHIGKFLMGITEIKLEQLRIAELAKSVCQTFRDNPQMKEMVCEKSGSWQSLAQAIVNEARTTQMFPPPTISWRSIGTVGQKSKMARIHAMEAPLASGQLLFKQGLPLLEALFEQMVNCDGSRSGTSLARKDDGPDSAALLMEKYFFPLFTTVQKSEEETTEEINLTNQRWLAVQHQAYFGTATGQLPMAPSTEQEPPSATQRYFGRVTRR
jgi:hypothetical protein